MSPTGLLLAAVVAYAMGIPIAAEAAGVRDVLEQPAQQVRRVASSALIDVTAAGDRLVAVGERGLVGLSDDGGTNWQQAQAPVSVTLTAVHFPTPQQGWAVGHGGVVLHSNDGGRAWVRQLDGRMAGELAVRAARSEAAPGHAAAVERLVSEGPDKPFLGVHFTDANRGFIVGAYGLAFETVDGGRAWQPILNRLDNPRGLHLYSVDAIEGTICIAGEQGIVLRSTDQGRTFKRIDSPYRGSYFTIACGQNDEVFVAGLNGNAYWSGDGGGRWERVESGARGSIVAVRRDGGARRLLVADQAGQILFSADGGRTLAPAGLRGSAPQSSFVLLADRRLVSVGLRGAVTHGPTTANSPTRQ